MDFNETWLVQEITENCNITKNCNIKKIIMLSIEFSKLSPYMNPSVAKEDKIQDMVNIVCLTLYKRASS